MQNIISAIKSTIPITSFNRGLAGKIFGEVKKNGPKVVIKNNKAECVLLSPEDYVALIDEVNDARLYLLAVQRMEKFDPSTLISEEEIDNFLHIHPDDLEGYEEVEFE